MAFDADIRHWSTLEAFTAHLAGTPRPAWVKKLVNHNTFRPNETQWKGIDSVEGCRQTYIEKGWDSGPHLFLAADAPNKTHTGIFQLTPIQNQGIHAGACNADGLGLESVGDFDARPPSAAQYTLLIAVNLLIMRHWMIPPEQVTVHNECMPGRTCPGKHLTGTMIRADLRKAIVDPWEAWGSRYPLSFEQRSWAIPKLWFSNRALGQCIMFERYLEPDNQMSIARFEKGFIWFYKPANRAQLVWYDKL